MKLFNVLLTTALISISTAQVAEACTYAIDKAAKTAELKAVALADLIDAKNVTAAVTEFGYFESKPTPMCPEEMTYNATFTVNYTTSFGSRCMAEMKVTKVEPWNFDGAETADTYSVTGRKSARCTR